jgi:hypothetical protein
MPRQTTLTPARRRAPQQLDLFAGASRTMIGGMPAWSGLPTEAQAALTDLMTRLILDHADKNWIGSMTEAGTGPATCAEGGGAGDDCRNG